MHVRFLQILRDRDSALVERVLGDGLVGVDGTQAITGDNLAVRGVARRVFYHVVLKRQADANFAIFETSFTSSSKCNVWNNTESNDNHYCSGKSYLNNKNVQFH